LFSAYYYRRMRMQESYDKPYSVGSRVKRRVMRRLREEKKKNDIKWKIANIIVKTAYKRQYAIVLERLGKKPASNIIERIRDKLLRHRIFQASFRGIQKAAELVLRILRIVARVRGCCFLMAVIVRVLGGQEYVVEFREGMRVIDVLRELGLMSTEYVVTKNNRVVAEDEPVGDGDVLVLFPVVSGG